MTVLDWHEEPIGRHHDRAGFDCGNDTLNEYLHCHARRNHEKGASKTFLAVGGRNPGAILGFYTLSPASISYSRTQEVVRRGRGRYEVAGFRLGRLAIASHMQGHGLGGQLLLAAARRCILASLEVGGTILVIDAKDERAARWYRSYGAIALDDMPRCLVLPLSTVAKLLEQAGKL